MYLHNVVQVRLYLRHKHSDELHQLQLQLTKSSIAGGAIYCPCGSLKAGDVGGRLHNFGEISSFPTNFHANIYSRIFSNGIDENCP